MEWRNVTKWGTVFLLFTFVNHWNLFWVYQNGNFLPGRKIRKSDFAHSEKYSSYAPAYEAYETSRLGRCIDGLDLDHTKNVCYVFCNFRLAVICDPTRANEALWGRYQNWHFKFNILFNIQGTFWHQNNFHIIFQSKVIDNLISNCLISLKINYWDMGRQSYWFVHKPIEDIKNNWIKI